MAAVMERGLEAQTNFDIANYVTPDGILKDDLKREARQGQRLH